MPLGLYTDSIKRGECDLPGCFCHELACHENPREKRRMNNLVESISISKINYEDKFRFRKELGDLRPLIESIERQGLIHPIVLTEDNQLICGRRRLAAYIRLDRSKIEVTYLNSSLNLREAETDENTYTKRFHYQRDRRN